MFDLEHIEDLYRELRDLNRRGREGVVLKSLDAKRCMKFVTPESDLDDLRSAMQIGFDLSSGFLFNRYLRATLFVKELGLDRDEYARRIGEAFLDGAPDPESFDESSERYVIYVQRQETWDQLRQLLGRQVLLRRDGAEPCRLYGRDMLKIRFRRIYQKSTHRYRRILNGHLHQD
jgi:putative ATP-dependent DNA ligase